MSVFKRYTGTGPRSDPANWVPVARGPQGVPGETGLTGSTGAVGSTGPQGPSNVWVNSNPPPDDTYVWVDTDDIDALAVPAGGLTGQVLSKIDGTDFNTEWVDPSSGTVIRDFFSAFRDAPLVPAWTGYMYPGMLKDGGANARFTEASPGRGGISQGDGSSITFYDARSTSPVYGQFAVLPGKTYAIQLYMYSAGPSAEGLFAYIDVFSYPDYNFFTEVSIVAPAGSGNSIALSKIVRLPELPVGDTAFAIEAAAIIGVNATSYAIYLDVLEL